MNKKRLRKHKKEIAEIRAMIPESPKCIDGCTTCCGNVPWAEVEWQEIDDHRVAPAANPLQCPYSVNGGCDVHESRPIICRLFTLVDNPKMTCPHGVRPKKLIPKKIERRIMQRYDQLVGKDFRGALRTERING